MRFTIAILLFLTVAARASIITFNLKDVTGLAIDQNVTLTRLDMPFRTGAGNLFSRPQYQMTSAAGVVTTPNLAQGVYAVSVGGYNFNIRVPNDSATYTLNSVVAYISAYLTDAEAYSVKVDSSDTTAGLLASKLVRPDGTALTVTNIGGNEAIIIEATGGGGGGSGEANTASNLGTGLGLFNGKSGIDLRFNSLIGAGGATISSNANALSVNAAGVSHTHSGADITSGTVSQSWIDAAITRDTEWNTIAKIEANVGPGVNIVTADEINTSGKVFAFVADPTGTGSLVFSISPTFTGTAGFESLTTSRFTRGGTTNLTSGASDYTWNGQGTAKLTLTANSTTTFRDIPGTGSQHVHFKVVGNGVATNGFAGATINWRSVVITTPGNGQRVDYDFDVTDGVVDGYAYSDGSHTHVISDINQFSSLQLAGQVTDETGSGPLVFRTSPLIQSPSISGAVAWELGTTQTFAPSSTNSGFNFGTTSVDPSSPVPGDAWYNSASDQIKGRISTGTVVLGSVTNSGGGGSVYVNGSTVSNPNFKNNYSHKFNIGSGTNITVTAPSVSTLAYSGTNITCDSSLSTAFKLTCTNDFGFAITGGTEGDQVRVRFIQDATGNRKFAISTATNIIAGAEFTGITLSTNSNYSDFVTFECSGSGEWAIVRVLRSYNLAYK